jgi:hypothetical protein
VNSYRAKLKLKYPDCWQWMSLARRIPGQLTENESNLLFQLARARTPSIDPVIVELGANQQQTSLFLAAGLRGKTNPRLFSMQPIGDQNLRRCRLGHIVNAAAAECNVAIDILIIQATGNDDTLHSDLSRWSPFVKLGGIVILHGVSPDLPKYLQPPRYSDVRHIDRLAWAVKQCAASLPTPPVSSDLDRLRLLLNRSIDAMLYLNTVPGRPGEPPSHLEDAAELALAKLQDYVRRTTREVAEHRHAIRALHRSWSWRLTAPLRFGIEVAQAIAGLLSAFSHGSSRTRFSGLVQWISHRSEVRASGLLDEHYYRRQNPGVAWARTSPLLHFFVCGASQGKNPNELFDLDFYHRCYPDVAPSGVNPLVHYLKTGAYQGRNPHPHFDSSFYLEQNPDVREARLNPLAHYLAPGIAEGRDPNPWFDTSEYLEQNPDVVTFGLNPLTHYLCSR